MKTVLICGLISLALTVAAGAIAIPVLVKLKAGQPVLGYVKTHEEKNGTPTMGGLFFITVAALVFFLSGGGKSRVATVSVTFGLAFLAVGCLDDYLKVKFRKNEGLKAYQKIIFQAAIALVAGAFVYKNGLTPLFVPFAKITVEPGWVSVPLTAFIFIAITNSVNLTDGLDGLAGGASAAYLLFISVIIVAECSFYDFFGVKEESDGLVLLSASLIGAILGFLVFNVSGAKVFMGDSGSLSLGGFIGAISVFSGNGLFVPILGATFVLSAISVIIQVAHYKRTKKRIFLMAPVHHHFQMKGYSESKIAYCYFLVTCITGALSVIFYL